MWEIPDQNSEKRENSDQKAENSATQDPITEEKKSGESTPNSTGKSNPFTVDKNGKVDLNDIVNEFTSEDVDEISQEELKKTPEAEIIENETMEEEKNSGDGNGESKVNAHEILDGELAFETTDFVAVAILCWLGKTDDEDQFNIPKKRRDRVVKLWDAYLKSIDYKVTPGQALAIVSAAIYGPMTVKSFRMRKEKNAEVKMKKPFQVHRNTDPEPVNPLNVEIPPVPDFEMPKKGTQGQKSHLQKEYEKIIMDQAKWIQEVAERLEKASGK